MWPGGGDYQTDNYFGEHRGLSWSKIILISIILLFILRVGDFCNTRNLTKYNVSQKKILNGFRNISITFSKGFEQKVATLRLKTLLKIKENSIGNFTTLWAALLMKPHLLLNFCTKSENFIHRTFVLNQKILVIGPLY